MNPYNGYTGNEREAKLRALHARVKRGFPDIRRVLAASVESRPCQARAILILARLLQARQCLIHPRVVFPRAGRDAAVERHVTYTTL